MKETDHKPMQASRRDSGTSPAADPLENKPWVGLVEECVAVIEDLERHMDDFDEPRREIAGHIVSRLEEALARSGVEVISDEEAFDRNRHRPVEESAANASDAAISEILSPGFVVGRRVLRRARVRLE